MNSKSPFVPDDSADLADGVGQPDETAEADLWFLPGPMEECEEFLGRFEECHRAGKQRVGVVSQASEQRVRRFLGQMSGAGPVGVIQAEAEIGAHQHCRQSASAQPRRCNAKLPVMPFRAFPFGSRKAWNRLRDRA